MISSQESVTAWSKNIHGQLGMRPSLSGISGYEGLNYKGRALASVRGSQAKLRAQGGGGGGGGHEGGFNCPMALI